MGHIAFFVFLSAPFIMLINGEAFEGTFDYEYTDGQLKLYTGASNVLASLDLDLSCLPMPE